MSAERLSMRKIKEVLRLDHLGLSGRKIARSLEISPATVQDYLRRARIAALKWPLPDDQSDEALELLLFGPVKESPTSRAPVDFAAIHAELRRKHVTLALLWEEYRVQHPEGYQYSRFCDLYRQWSGKLKCWMRQEHKGGEKLFVDFSGDGIPWFDLKSGEKKEAALFVAVLGASNCTFALATDNQQLPAWIEGHVKALEFIQGVPAIIVPDQPRTSTSKPCRYDPDLNPVYQDFGTHYSTCIIPARPRRPRDKAKVEVGVLIAQRWIIAALRNRTFYSISAINVAIRELLEKLNDRKQRKLGRSRKELFEEFDKPNLKALPEHRFEFAEWKVGIRVNLDYHIEFERNYYSVPFQLWHHQVELRATGSTVEIFHKSKRVASHLRLPKDKHQYSTQIEHMPKSHQAHAEWTPIRMLNWAGEVGSATRELSEKIIQGRQHPQQGFRACRGIVRLAKKYTKERLELACQRALRVSSYSYRAVESILKRNLESQPLPETPKEALPHHDNIRGCSYYN